MGVSVLLVEGIRMDLISTAFADESNGYAFHTDISDDGAAVALSARWASGTESQILAELGTLFTALRKIQTLMA